MKEVVTSPTPWCCSKWKGRLLVTHDTVSQLIYNELTRVGRNVYYLMIVKHNMYKYICIKSRKTTLKEVGKSIIYKAIFLLCKTGLSVASGIPLFEGHPIKYWTDPIPLNFGDLKRARASGVNWLYVMLRCDTRSRV